jgi:hypothetical protein
MTENTISGIIVVQIEALEKANALCANKLDDENIEAHRQFISNCQTMVQFVDVLIRMEQEGLPTGLRREEAE